MRLIPRLRWEILSIEDSRELGLSTHWVWEGLSFEWLGRGMLFCARVVRRRWVD